MRQVLAGAALAIVLQFVFVEAVGAQCCRLHVRTRSASAANYSMVTVVPTFANVSYSTVAMQPGMLSLQPNSMGLLSYQSSLNQAQFSFSDLGMVFRILNCVLGNQSFGSNSVSGMASQAELQAVNRRLDAMDDKLTNIQSLLAEMKTDEGGLVD